MRNDTQVDWRAVMYLLSDTVNRARSINDSQQFGQVSIQMICQQLNVIDITIECSGSE